MNSSGIFRARDGKPAIRPELSFLPWLLACFFLLTDRPARSQTLTNTGTDFWVAFQDNFMSYDPSLYFYVSSEYNTSGYVSSAYPGVNQSFTITAGVTTYIPIPMGAQMKNGIEDKGIHITSVHPITVYGLNIFGGSSAGFMAFPVNTLGTDYRVVSYKLQSSSIADDPSRFSVVATQDNTLLTVFNRWTGQTNIVTLNQGQTYFSEFTPISNQDITGSRIQSNYPVAVFGSNDCVYIPDRPCQACDHTAEQIFPYDAWGRKFATVPTGGRDESGDIFRVLAANDGTEVNVNGSLVATLNSGNFYETLLTGNNYITTSKPSLVAQFAKGQECSGGVRGDPLMMLIVPMEQFLTHYNINTVGSFTWNGVNLVAPADALGKIYEDGVAIPASIFTPIPGTTYYGAQRQIMVGTHVYDCIYPFGLYAYGWTNANSYGYPGGCSISHVATVQSITLTPSISYGELNVTTVCLTAHVTDSQGNPVPDILVNFSISGLGPMTGFAYTDASGEAVYCYTRTGTIPGTDFVFAEVSGITSNTVMVIWTYGPPCDNPTNGGTIGYDQERCGAYVPAPILSLSLPSGEQGVLEYKWQQSILGSTSGFTDIPGTNMVSFGPGTVTQTTWFRRLARVDCKTSWIGAAESNVTCKAVIAPLPVSVGITAADSLVCEGASASFTAAITNGGPAPSIQWRVNGVAAGTGSPLFSYQPADGDRIDCMVTSGDTCVTNNPATSNSVRLTVLPYRPVGVSIAASANPACRGDSVTLTAQLMNPGANPYFQWWINGTPGATNLQANRYLPADGDRVICRLTSNYPCTTTPYATDTIDMTVKEVLKVVDTTMCHGVPYYAEGQWRTTAGVYHDTLHPPVDCIRFIETHLAFKPPIPLDLGPDTNLCHGTIILDVTVNGATYRWQDGTTDAIYSADSPGHYWVDVTVDDCLRSDSISIDGCPVPLQFPSAFTPDGDGLNDTFHPVGIDVPYYSMLIFNRWGEKLFETSIVEPGWDGTYKGERCPEDTYVFLVNYENRRGERVQVRGYVVLTGRR